MSVGEAAIHKSRIKLKPDNRSRNYTDEFYFVQINVGTITVQTTLKLAITPKQLKKVYLPQNSPIRRISQAAISYKSRISYSQKPKILNC